MLTEVASATALSSDADGEYVIVFLHQLEF
jgi:hypothetical protein